jgi:hypothetical protein
LRSVCLACVALMLDEIDQEVDAAIHVFLAAYGLQPARI